MGGKDIGQEEAGRGGRKEREDEEGRFLLGRPTFTSMGNGRFKCTETGHEVLAKDMESYGNSKRCRLGLIDVALLHKKPPLNLFEQHSVSKSKLICKLTKDTINKSEEHIWKHISGRRFQNRLEQKELEIKTSKGTVEQADVLSLKASTSDINGVKKVRNNKVGKGDSPTKKPIDNNSDTEEPDNNSDIEEPDNNSDTEEPDFWMPPIGNRWDLDDGNDRWGSCTNLAHETDEDAGIVNLLHS
ncbi:uncharacterized protein LOC131239857 isoform X2 [Magnolia sinica]|uniref:uncharacterized protein LOC131239857 isoform X2 n=1 Tax=Magnolia sinica TaxID=86752 RepID=UPI00265AF525|nr:uncharacterized protein LOC131239857 isoform X2 [Magnolia sinica]